MWAVPVPLQRHGVFGNFSTLASIWMSCHMLLLENLTENKHHPKHIHRRKCHRWYPLFMSLFCFIFSHPLRVFLLEENFHCCGFKRRKTTKVVYATWKGSSKLHSRKKFSYSSFSLKCCRWVLSCNIEIQAQKSQIYQSRCMCYNIMWQNHKI